MGEGPELLSFHQVHQKLFLTHSQRNQRQYALGKPQSDGYALRYPSLLRPAHTSQSGSAARCLEVLGCTAQGTLTRAFLLDSAEGRCWGRQDCSREVGQPSRSSNNGTGQWGLQFQCPNTQVPTRASLRHLQFQPHGGFLLKLVTLRLLPHLLYFFRFLTLE